MSDKTYGQIGFEAYGDHANWTAWDGKPMPRWDDALRADIKEKWEVAGKAISDKAVADFLNSAVERHERGKRVLSSGLEALPPGARPTYDKDPEKP